ncbi:MAG: hypothetical protein ACRDRT_19370, partial [Pseudonocardiaceae bacterium]
VVEHHLAKVRVAGSNPVVRSKTAAGDAGMTDSSGLDYVSRLLGDEHLPARLSDGIGRGDDRQREGSVATVPLVPPATLRRMHPGDALLIHGTLPPAHVRLRPWYRDRRLRNRTPSGA